MRSVPCKTRPMNMGGPGDHWYTDLFVWDVPAFGEPSDSLLRDIRRFGGDLFLRDGQPLGERLSVLWPRWVRVDDQALRDLASDLVRLRDVLRADAESRGWEIE